MSASAGEMRISSTGAVTAGTRTINTNAAGNLILPIANTTNTVFASRVKLLDFNPAKHPQILAAASGATSEGIIIRATVPATGVWGFNLEMDWDEVPLVNY